MVNLTEENYEEEAMKANMPVIIDFYADWCGPCQAIGPVLADLELKYKGKAKICKINIDEQKKLARSNQVMSIPTLFFVKDGQIKERITGGLSQHELESKIEALF